MSSGELAVMALTGRERKAMSEAAKRPIGRRQVPRTDAVGWLMDDCRSRPCREPGGRTGRCTEPFLYFDRRQRWIPLRASLPPSHATIRFPRALLPTSPRRHRRCTLPILPTLLSFLPSVSLATPTTPGATRSLALHRQSSRIR